MSHNIYSYITCQSDTKWMNGGGDKESTCVTGFHEVWGCYGNDYEDCCLLGFGIMLFVVRVENPCLKGLQMFVN